MTEISQGGWQSVLAFYNLVVITTISTFVAISHPNLFNKPRRLGLLNGYSALWLWTHKIAAAVAIKITYLNMPTYSIYEFYLSKSLVLSAYFQPTLNRSKVWLVPSPKLMPEVRMDVSIDLLTGIFIRL